MKDSGVGQTCAPLNGQKQSKEVEQQTATGWPCHFDRVVHGHGAPQILTFPPAGKSQFDCLYVSLTGHGAAFRQHPPLYNEGATSQFFQPFSPATTLGQTKQLMACKLKQRRLVCLCVCVCVLENVGHAPSIFQGLISVLMSWFLDTARRHGCHPCGLISAVCQSTMCTNLYIGHS